MILLVTALAAVFFGTILTGPAGVEWREKRRARRQLELDAPRAQVLYLPSAACREPVFTRADAVDFVDV